MNFVQKNDFEIRSINFVVGISKNVSRYYFWVLMVSQHVVSLHICLTTQWTNVLVNDCISMKRGKLFKLFIQPKENKS